MSRPLRGLIRQFVALGAGNYGAMACSLVINSLLARRLGVSGFGTLALLLMASQVASLLAVNWTHTALIRFGAEEFALRQEVSCAFWTRVWIVLPWCLAVAGVILAARTPLAAYLGVSELALFSVFLHFMATLVLMTVGAVFQARSQMQAYGAVLFGDKAIMAALVLMLPQHWLHDPARVLVLFASSSLAVAAAGLIVLGSSSLLPLRFDRAAYRRMLAFSMPLILSSWSGLLGTSWFDLVVIKSYWPVSDVGIYSVGSTVATVVQQIIVIFSTFLLPQLSMMIARKEERRLAAFIERLLPYWFLGISIAFSVVALNVGWAVPLVFGPEYEPSVRIVIWLMPASAAFGIISALSPVLTAMGATWTLAGIQLVSGIVNVLMDVALIPRFGIEGSAVATAIAYAVAAVLTLVAVQTRRGVRVVTHLLFTLPVVAVSLCAVAFSGPLFHVSAIVAATMAVWGLVRRFGLLERDDDGVLADVLAVVGVPSSWRWR